MFCKSITKCSAGQYRTNCSHSFIMEGRTELDELTWAFLVSKLPPTSELDARKSKISQMARDLGISEKMVELVIVRKRNLSTENAQKLASKFGLSHLEMLQAGKALSEKLPHHRRLAPRRHSLDTPFNEKVCPNVIIFGEFKEKPEINLENYYAAPLVSGTIAAGPGRMIDDSDIKNLVWIYAPELRNRVHHRLTAVQIESNPGGDSMAPTLLPGDIVLIDHDDPHLDEMGGRGLRSGHIYAIRTGSLDAGCSIKRLYKVDHGILVSSDNNKVYPPEMAWTHDVQQLVIGRVVWGWRNLLDI